MTCICDSSPAANNSIPPGIWPAVRIASTAACLSSQRSAKVDETKTWSFFFCAIAFLSWPATALYVDASIPHRHIFLNSRW
jgi:hypothetical protein